MRWWEINRCMVGIQRRWRNTWEMTRAIQWSLACIHHDTTKGAPPQHPKDLYQFPWDKDELPKAAEITDEEVAQMQELMRNYPWN